jgi:1,4-dihydroxy-2-naphthoate polyprenyltransferase
VSAPPALPSGVKAWVVGSRPRTLPAAIVPVAVGTAIAHAQRPLGSTTSVVRAALALGVSLALQVGVNYANDYSDGVKGTDNVRVGPLRLVGSGVKSAKAVKTAALGSLGVAAIAGLVLAALTSWWLIAVGLAALLAAWGYTGGPRPYGYAGLGEVFVFVFFGLVAVAGSAFVQHERITAASVFGAFPVGLLATALLVTNNLRDIPGDTIAKKNTLAVRLGDGNTRRFYVGLVVVAFLSVGALCLSLRSPWPLVSLGAAALAVTPVKTVVGGAKGRDLIAVLGATGKVQLAMGALLVVGVLV